MSKNKKSEKTTSAVKEVLKENVFDSDSLSTQGEEQDACDV